MSEFRKANTDHPYFLTLTVVGWIDIFTRSIYSDVIMQSLRFCQKNKGLEVYAYVIMPNHVHLVVRSLDKNLYDTIRDFKSYTAKEIIRLIEDEPGESRREWLLHMFRFYGKFKKNNKKYRFWQGTNHPTELSDPDVFDQKIDYIHDNPVVAGYVTDPESWQYSSACIYTKLELAE